MRQHGKLRSCNRGGGSNNTASSTNATVGGGDETTPNTAEATVGGGG